jgi:eukaryotic-like serine/threonine-protein kinase
VREAFRRSVEGILEAGTAETAGLAYDAIVALDTGDFATAEAKLIALEKGAATSVEESDHDPEGLMLLYEEEGVADKELLIANAFMRKLPSWTMSPTPTGRSLALAVRHRGGLVSDAEVASTLALWMRQPRFASNAFGGRLPLDDWIAFYAMAVRTRGEALEALKHLSSARSLRTIPKAAGASGRVYFLAGDVAAAIPLLRQESAWCGDTGNIPLPIAWTIPWIRDNFYLGQALEQQGDKPGACAAYAKVLTRWGHAKPRSVTAEKVRERTKALGCAPVNP